MNFLRDKPLKMLALYLVAALSGIFIAEYLVVRHALSRLTEAERKIDFARSVQVQGQQLALHVQTFIHGKRDIAAEVTASVDHQEFLLKTLGEGGRIEGSTLFLEPLSLLPSITFDNLKQSWTQYREAIHQIVLPGEPTPTKMTSLALDSVGAAEQSVPADDQVTETPQSNIAFDAHWLSLTRWYDRLITDLEAEGIQRQSDVVNWFSFFVFLNISLAICSYYLFRQRVIAPLAVIEAQTSRSEFSENLRRDEIGNVASRVNATIEDLRDATEFVISIGEGKLDLDYVTLDANYAKGKNKLADSLIEMQSKLKSLSEEEGKRQWVNEGLTKFVDILRSSNDSLSALGDKIIAALVQYTNSNQGAIYILNDDEVHNKYLELISLFAFEIKKFEQQKIKLGEGILGQTFLERETTYITDLPETFIRITSGLGEAPPRSVLMVPLKVDTQVYGILELASFQAYHPHEIAFVEKLGESIAATLASVRGAQKNRLLIEQFQQQTEQMRAQEEEMRQNMEELQATQEEIARKEKSYIERINMLEAQPGSETLRDELRELRSGGERKDKEHQLRVAELNRQLAQKPAHGDDWELASEVEKTLRINLEALEITRSTIEKK